MSVVSDTLYPDLFLFHSETKNSNLVSSVICLICFFPTKRVVGRKTSLREEETNDANTKGSKPKVPGEKPHCFSSPRGWRARENLTKTSSKRATGKSGDDSSGKRLRKVEKRKGMQGPISLRIDIRSQGHSGSFLCQTVDNEKQGSRCEIWRCVDYSIVNWRAKEKRNKKK